MDHELLYAGIETLAGAASWAQLDTMLDNTLHIALTCIHSAHKTHAQRTVHSTHNAQHTMHRHTQHTQHTLCIHLVSFDFVVQQVANDHELLLARIEKLSGAAGVARLQAALEAARTAALQSLPTARCAIWR